MRQKFSAIKDGVDRHRSIQLQIDGGYTGNNGFEMMAYRTTDEPNSRIDLPIKLGINHIDITPGSGSLGWFIILITVAFHFGNFMGMILQRDKLTVCRKRHKQHKQIKYIFDFHNKS